MDTKEASIAADVHQYAMAQKSDQELTFSSLNVTQTAATHQPTFNTTTVVNSSDAPSPDEVTSAQMFTYIFIPLGAVVFTVVVVIVVRLGFSSQFCFFGMLGSMIDALLKSLTYFIGYPYVKEKQVRVN